VPRPAAGQEIIGRDAELDSISAFLSAIDGPRALILEGEAGIGKTTLWEAAVQRARDRSYLVIASRPGGAETRLSFAALSDLVEPVIADVLPDLPPPQRRALEVALLISDAGDIPVDPRAIAAGLAQVLRTLAAARPVIVALDDIQWLDEPSAGAIEFALRRVREQPVAVIAARRTGEGARIPLDLDRSFSNLRRIALGPLALGAIHHLVASRLATPLPRPTLIRLQSASGGNPFYALEIARALQRSGLEGSASGDHLPVPDHLQDLVRARLETLSSGTRKTLLSVALMTHPTVAVVREAAASPGDVDAGIEEAAATGIVALDGDAIRFTHPLLVEGVLSGATLASRQDAHRRLAGVVHDTEERARHLALAATGPDPVIAVVLDEAATVAAARGAPDAAAALLDLAAKATPADAAGKQADRQILAAAHRVVAGELEAARASLDPLVPTLVPGRQRARALLELATTREDDLPLQARYLEQAASDAGDDDGLLARIRTRQADCAGSRGRFPEGLAFARMALECGERSGDQRAIAMALSELAAGEQRAGRVTPGLLERAIEMESSLPDLPPGYRSARRARAIRHLCADRLDEARIDLLGAHRRALEQGDMFEETLILFHLSQVEYLSGDLAGAHRYAEEGYELTEQLAVPQTMNTLRCGRALVAACQGREEGRADAETALRSAEAIDDGLGRIRSRAVLGFIETSAGNAAAALDYLRPLPALTPTAAPGEFRFLANLVEALIAVREDGEAEALLVGFENGAGLSDTPWTRACSRRCRGLLLAEQKKLAEAIAMLESALVEHDGLPIPLERGRTLLALGQVQRRAKQKRTARESLQAALAIFEHLGAPVWAERASAELARVGGRSPSPVELTPTERKIAELVATGMSNHEVARVAYVSVSTVESNLSRAYSKLGVHSRTELAARLRGDVAAG